MNSDKINRRNFIKNTALVAAAFGFAGNLTFCKGKVPHSKNPLPRWKGFNLLDFFSLITQITT